MKQMLRLLILVLLVSSAQAQQILAHDDEASAVAGGLPDKYITGTCGATNCGLDVNVVGSSMAAASAATFAAMDVTVPGDIGAAYANVLDLPDGTKMVLFDNQTNGDVDISLDGGVSTHYSLKGGDTLALNLAQFGLVTTVAVWVKDGTTASTAGAFNISSFK